MQPHLIYFSILSSSLTFKQAKSLGYWLSDLSLWYWDGVKDYPSSSNAINQTVFSNEGHGNLLTANGGEQ